MQSRCEKCDSKCPEFPWIAIPWISATQSNYSPATQMTLAHVEIKILLSPVTWKTRDVTNTSFRILTFRPWRWKQQVCPNMCYSFSMLRGVNKQLSSPPLTWKPQTFIFTAPNTSNLHIHFSETLKASIHCHGKLKFFNSLLWESKSFVTTAMKTSKLHIHCPENLKATHPLLWKLHIFKFTAMRIWKLIITALNTSKLHIHCP